VPDLISHCLANRIFAQGKLKKYLLFFLIGTILPDVLTRAPLFFLSNCYRCNWFIGVLHSPIPSILAAALICLLFIDKKPVFFAVLSGIALHLFFDAFQKHLVGGYYWLYPFSFWTGEWGLFWPETSIKFIPFLLFASIAVYGAELYWKGKKAR